MDLVDYLFLGASLAAGFAAPIILQRWRWRREDRRLGAQRVARFDAFCEWASNASLAELDDYAARRRAERPAWRTDG